MLKFARIAFIIFGIIFIVVGIFGWGISKGPAATAFLGLAIFGLAQVFLGICMKRIGIIEDKLARYIFDEYEDDPLRVKCEKCGKKYDADVDKCPYCELGIKKPSIF